MVVMLVSYILTALTVDLAIVYLISQYKYQLIIYWNTSNLVYTLLNVILVFIINFQPHPCVRYCFLKCCYYVEEEAKILEEKGQTSLKESTYISQKPMQNSQISNQNKCGWIVKVRDWFIGSFYSFLSVVLILIITISIVYFCLRIREQKADQMNHKQLYNKKRSSIQSNSSIKSKISIIQR